MLHAIKIYMTDTLIMTDIQYYTSLVICFILGFPVGVLLYTFTGKLIRAIWRMFK